MSDGWKDLKMNAAIDKVKLKVEQAYHTKSGQRAWLESSQL